ncbi:MAG: type I methionyl aminopeptidase [Gammaproteobacteria bacterium]
MPISLKSPSEQDAMRRACRLTAETLNMVGQAVQPGVTTGELNDLCHDYIAKQGARPAPLHYRGFPKSICTSVNQVVCHGIPGPKKLKSGDIVNIDVTVVLDGWHGDASRMYFVGEPSILAKRLVETTRIALFLGIQAVAPGRHLGDIGSVIEYYANENGVSVVREYCGHGIGHTFHEDPQVLHYGSPDTGIELVPGMVFTIEPMLNAGKRFVKTLPDGWTVVTRDHSLSAQWEHTILVTEAGHEILTWSDYEQAILGLPDCSDHAIRLLHSNI